MELKIMKYDGLNWSNFLSHVIPSEEEFDSEITHHDFCPQQFSKLLKSDILTNIGERKTKNGNFFSFGTLTIGSLKITLFTNNYDEPMTDNYKKVDF
jgi:hypothetical protein